MSVLVLVVRHHNEELYIVSRALVGARNADRIHSLRLVFGASLGPRTHSVGRSGRTSGKSSSWPRRVEPLPASITFVLQFVKNLNKPIVKNRNCQGRPNFVASMKNVPQIRPF